MRKRETLKKKSIKKKSIRELQLHLQENLIKHTPHKMRDHVSIVQQASEGGKLSSEAYEPSPIRKNGYGLMDQVAKGGYT